MEQHHFAVYDCCHERACTPKQESIPKRISIPAGTIGISRVANKFPEAHEGSWQPPARLLGVLMGILKGLRQRSQDLHCVTKVVKCCNIHIDIKSQYFCKPDRSGSGPAFDWYYWAAVRAAKSQQFLFKRCVEEAGQNSGR